MSIITNGFREVKLIYNRKETALNGLVNNAGIMGVPFSKTADGYDVQFQVHVSIPLFSS